MQSMNEIKFKVVEIFDSIDGEGQYAGCLATFIRLVGCNLRCSYCDTTYAFTGGNEMSIDEILRKVNRLGNNHITLTGGEPLIHTNISQLVEKLCKDGYIVNIETNGAIDISDYINKPVTITMDYKTLSSGVNHLMRFDNIELLRSRDVLKIVCCEDDFDDIENLVEKYNIYATIYLSPIYGKIEPAKLVEFAKQLRDKHGIFARVQLQLHKIIWNPNERGV